MCEEMTDNQDDWCLISRDEKVGWVGLGWRVGWWPEHTGLMAGAGITQSDSLRQQGAMEDGLE